LGDLKGIHMTTAKTIGYGVGGFTLSLLTAAVAGIALQYLFISVWTPPESFLVAYGSTLAIAITAVASTWVCLLQGLKNKAMIRGVWCHIYAFTAIGALGLALTLFM
jgi:hypothetical protein